MHPLQARSVSGSLELCVIFTGAHVLVARFTPRLWARHRCVPVFDIEPARVTIIPIVTSFHRIGWGPKWYIGWGAERYHPSLHWHRGFRKGSSPAAATASTTSSSHASLSHWWGISRIVATVVAGSVCSTTSTTGTAGEGVAAAVASTSPSAGTARELLCGDGDLVNRRLWRNG